MMTDSGTITLTCGRACNCPPDVCQDLDARVIYDGVRYVRIVINRDARGPTSTASYSNHSGFDYTIRAMRRSIADVGRFISRALVGTRGDSTGYGWYRAFDDPRRLRSDARRPDVAHPRATVAPRRRTQRALRFDRFHSRPARMNTQ